MSIFALFLEGLLSFLSPCVLPLVPLYMSYLSINAKEVDEQGNVKYKTFKVFLMTLFFVLGISTIFLILALSIDVVKPFIDSYSEVVSIVGGTIIIIFGLNATGLIHIDVLNNEKRLNVNINKSKMSYFKAYLLGLLFTFAWSPCIGPLLASAILIASSEDLGSLYLLVYALGLVIPFLLTGLFTTKLLEFFKNKKDLFKYVMVVAGIIMIIYGGYMVYNSSKDIIAYKNNTNSVSSNKIEGTFVDQNGNKIKFDDYKGKYVFINYTTTWCTYCKAEIPDYLDFSKNGDDYVCLYVMSPLTSGEGVDSIKKYISDNNIDIPVIIDEEEIIYSKFVPDGYPIIYVLNKDGEYIGYFQGATNIDGFNQLIENVRTNY